MNNLNSDQARTGRSLFFIHPDTSEVFNIDGEAGNTAGGQVDIFQRGFQEFRFAQTRISEAGISEGTQGKGRMIRPAVLHEEAFHLTAGEIGIFGNTVSD